MTDKVPPMESNNDNNDKKRAATGVLQVAGIVSSPQPANLNRGRNSVLSELWFQVCSRAYVYAKTIQDTDVALYLKQDGTAVAHGPKSIELRDLPTDCNEDSYYEWHLVDHQPHYVVGRFFYEYEERKVIPRNPKSKDTFMVMVDRPTSIKKYDDARCHVGPVTLAQFQRCELCVDADPDYTEQRHVKAECCTEFCYSLTATHESRKFCLDYIWDHGMMFKKVMTLRAEFECTNEAMHKGILARGWSAAQKEDDDAAVAEELTAGTLFMHVQQHCGYNVIDPGTITMTRMFFLETGHY